MKKANDYQVGGDHYATTGGKPQHWDVISCHEVGYLEGIATGYVSRWRSKGGLEDLHKAKHCTVKLIELFTAKKRQLGGKVPVQACVEFASAYDLQGPERAACSGLLTWVSVTDLYDVLAALDKVISEAIAQGYRLKSRPAVQHVDNTGQAQPFGYVPEEVEGR